MTDEFESTLRDHLAAEARDVREFPRPLRNSIREELGGRTNMSVRLIAIGAPLLLAVVIGYSLYALSPRPVGVTPAGPASPSPMASPTVEPSTAASPAAESRFVCQIPGASGSRPPTAQLVGVRAASQEGFDRITFEFSGSVVPAYQFSGEGPSTTFVKDPSGQEVTLLGRNGLKLAFTGGSGVDDNGNLTYTGSKDVKPGLRNLMEAAELGDFERVLSWGFGYAGDACARVTELKGPPRLVVDFGPGGAFLSSPSP